MLLLCNFSIVQLAYINRKSICHFPTLMLSNLLVYFVIHFAHEKNRIFMERYQPIKTWVQNCLLKSIFHSWMRSWEVVNCWHWTCRVYWSRFWWSWQDSNLQSAGSKPSALSIRPHDPIVEINEKLQLYTDSVAQRFNTSEKKSVAIIKVLWRNG